MFDRICLMKAMHTVVCALNDEEAYCEWINLVPDDANNDDLVDIAEDDWLFQDACNTFREIMLNYSEGGFYVHKKRW